MNKQPPEETWEQWIKNLMGEKLYKGETTDFTATHIIDKFQSEIREAEEQGYERGYKEASEYTNYFGLN